MAHVQRGDCAAQLVSSAAAALYWFNPLVWIARRRQAAERELACDDAVLASGAAGADYAWHLLEIARASGRVQRLAPAGVMMARKSQLEGRLLAVLDSGRNRRQVSRFASMGVIAASALLVLPLAGLRPWAAPEAEASELSQALPATAAAAPRSVAPPAAAAPEVPAPTVSEFGALATGAQDEATRERVRQMMIGLLADEDASIRSEAVHSLGMMEDERAVTALADTVVNDAATAVRSQAAWALGMIESDAAVGALVTALGDSATSVRSQAAWALGMIESDSAVDGLVGALQDDSASVRSQSAWALGMIESPNAVAGLVGVLLADEAASVRSQAAWALGMIEDESAVENLIDAVEDGDESVRKQALWAISQIMG
jgi:hypothetical protein